MTTANETLREAERLLRDAASPLPAPRAGRAIVRRMSDVRPREIDWLWPGWLARGKLHLLGGHPGDGKSTLTAWLAARLSRPGQAFPDGAPAPECVSLFLLAEDALDDTFRPRLDAMGAAAERVLALAAIQDDATGRETMFSLTAHVPLLAAAIRETGAGLVVIDPLSSFLPGRDRNAEGDVRDALTPLGKLAEATGAAVLGVMHVGKAQHKTATQSLLGSTGFGAIARAVWLVAADPDDAAGERKALGVVKSNIARKPAPLLWSRPDDGPLRWHGAAGRAMEEIFAGPVRTTSSDAEAFLLDQLKGGMQPAAQVNAAAQALGITDKMLRTARARLGIEATRPGKQTGPWYLKLPDGEPAAGDAAAEEGSEPAVPDAQMPGSQTPFPTRPEGVWENPHELVDLPVPDAQTLGPQTPFPRRPEGVWEKPHELADSLSPDAQTPCGHVREGRLGNPTPAPDARASGKGRLGTAPNSPDALWACEEGRLGTAPGSPDALGACGEGRLGTDPDSPDARASGKGRLDGCCAECGRAVPSGLGGRACLAHGGVPADPVVARYVRVLAEFTPEELVAYRAELANPPADDPPSAAEYAALAIVTAAREPA